MAKERLRDVADLGVKPGRDLMDLHVKKIEAAPTGERAMWRDTEVRRLFVRVTDKGQKSFVLYTRFPSTSAPSRRTLGEVGELTLAGARAKARNWLEQIKYGKDPRDAEIRAKALERTKRATTFAAVAEDFIRDKLPRERRGSEVESIIRRELIPLLGNLPITEITKAQIRDIIAAKRAKYPTAARNLLSIIKRFFEWAIDQDVYGIETSPAWSVKAKHLIGDKIQGERTLSDTEVFALDRAIARMSYPYGAVYRTLLSTALRLNEAADAHWSEINLQRREWTIPASRMKGKNGKARDHVVPITDDMLALLQGLPLRKGYLFSTTSGKSPVWMNGKVKKRIDARMLRTLRAIARKRGEDPSDVILPPWKNHDIRRTVRSGLSMLKIPEAVGEAVLAHVQPGVQGTYNRHQYLDEKRDALERWSRHVDAMRSENAPANNVITLPTRA